MRDLVENMTDRECYLNTRGFIAFLEERGEIEKGAEIALGGDLRPSTPRIMASVSRAVEDSGYRPAGCGILPSPALANFAFDRRIPSVMVTGSHIPADRNGIKFNRKTGEVLKSDEDDILRNVARVREDETLRAGEQNLFTPAGAFRSPPEACPETEGERARELYRHRYLDSFPGRPLEGIRLVFYQHSAAGRDLISSILENLGAEVVPVGRSDDFIAVDTEKITEATRDTLEEAARKHRPFAVVSTDGDSDRPLLADEEGRFLPGDKLGALASLYLRPAAVALPVSTNDGVVSFLKKEGVKVRLARIGSPHVIRSMNDIRDEDPTALVAGWEANGGYLLGSDWPTEGKTLSALPTRDAVLPLLVVIILARREGLSLSRLIKRKLPARFTGSTVVDNAFPGCGDYTADVGKKIISAFSPTDPSILEAHFGEGSIMARRGGEGIMEAAPEVAGELLTIKSRLEGYFRGKFDLGEIISINFLDGVRITFAGGEVSHLRPSGNAPEFRNYAAADTGKRAGEIIAAGKEIIPRMIRDLAGIS